MLQNIADQKPKIRYIVAVDDSKVTLKQITKSVSKHLGTGKFKNVALEDALLNKDLTVCLSYLLNTQNDLNCRKLTKIFHFFLKFIPISNFLR